MTNIVWFRQDLRLADNPALTHAASRGPVVGVYVLDETAPPGGRPLGGASRWWLHRSLEALQNAGCDLVLLRGDPLDVIPKLAQSVRASGVFWNRCYEPYAIARDTQLKSDLTNAGLDVASFNASLIFEPWQVSTQAGGPFKVYSAFWRACLKESVPAATKAPAIEWQTHRNTGDRLADWNLLPTRPNWAASFEDANWEDKWQPGEVGAQTRFGAFLESGLDGYSTLRDRPDRPNVSRLSPHLHFGEISPRQIWAATEFHASKNLALQKDAGKFLAEIGWREFAYHLLYHFPNLPDRNWKPAFDAYPWADHASSHLTAWQQGMTGFPIVDAGMRELWQTGYMHNRVRMVVASFLVKHLRIHWKHGESWFWDTLVDADLANNAASWQWVTGSGADAAPYFRIFNPMTQGRKFDPDGLYVRKWCPELKRLPDKFIHAPFEAPPELLRASGVTLGKTYPSPIVEHAAARAAALEGYDLVKAVGAD